MRLTFLAPIATLMIAATPLVAAAQGRGTQPTQPQTTRPQQPVAVRQGPVSSASADTLVQCVPIATPVKRESVAKPVRRRRRVRPRPRPAATVAKPPVTTPKPKPAAKPVHRRRRVAPRPRPVLSAANNAPARGNLPSLVMCRPIHPVTPTSVGPLPETVVPIPQIASVTPPAAAIPVEEVPSYIAAAGPHSQFLPLALIPAFFVPFIHSSHHNTPTVDTTGVTPPPPPPPPTTVPEPSSVAMLASGLIALGGVTERRRRRRKR